MNNATYTLLNSRILSRDITPSQIITLGREAGQHGDLDLVRTTQLALWGNEPAIDLCVEIIKDSKARARQDRF